MNYICQHHGTEHNITLSPKFRFHLQLRTPKREDLHPSPLVFPPSHCSPGDWRSSPASTTSPGSALRHGRGTWVDPGSVSHIKGFNCRCPRDHFLCPRDMASSVQVHLTKRKDLPQVPTCKHVSGAHWIAQVLRVISRHWD